MKTNRGAAKRFSRTGSGKIRRSRAYLRHILTTKTTKQKRHLRKRAAVDGVNVKSIKRLIPYV
jgi:large subunit ribosomal protein L35